MKTHQLLFMLLIISLSVLGKPAQAGRDVALITALDGDITRVVDLVTHKLEPFVKLKEGDMLNTSKNSYIQIIYFENGRQESWNGAGKLEITQTESHAIGLLNPQVKQIPLIIVRQLARTPSLDSQSRAGAMRLRFLTIHSQEDIANLEKTYKDMRAEAAHDDLNPEVYLLAGMFNLKQFDRVEKILDQLKRKWSPNKQAKVLIALYSKALRNTTKSSSME